MSCGTGPVAFLVLNELLLALLALPPALFRSGWSLGEDGAGGRDPWEGPATGAGGGGGVGGGAAQRVYAAGLVALTAVPLFSFVPVSVGAIVVRLLARLACLAVFQVFLAYCCVLWARTEAAKLLLQDSRLARLIYVAAPANLYGCSTATQIAKLAGTSVLALRWQPHVRFLDADPSSAAAWILLVCTVSAVAADIALSRSHPWASWHLGYYASTCLYSLYYLTASCRERPAIEHKFIFGLTLVIACLFGTLKLLHRLVWKRRKSKAAESRDKGEGT